MKVCCEIPVYIFPIAYSISSPSLHLRPSSEQNHEGFLPQSSSTRYICACHLRSYSKPSFQWHSKGITVCSNLTLSPTAKEKIDHCTSMIEANLDAICRTPTIQRTTLNEHLRLPDLRIVAYQSLLDGLFLQKSLSLPYLLYAYDSMDNINNDPYLRSLSRDSLQDELNYQKALKTGSYAMKEMKSLVNKSKHVCEEYGAWAGDFYISMVVNRFMEIVQEKEDELVGWDDEEKLYLMDILSTVKTFEMSDKALLNSGALSSKVEKLIEILVEEYEKDMALGSFSGIIFVEQRVGVSVLAEILSRHPKTKNIFRCGNLVGTSQNLSHSGKNIAEIVDSKKAKTTLGDFRTGDKNLIIATSVAEEGLDVQACHLVVCCYMQKNRKSYIQMRGRARRKNSTYVLMFPDESLGRANLMELEAWEKEMQQAYQEERSLLEKEAEDRVKEEDGPEKLYISETK